tara:strand:- start:115 stop:1368 length:1254 start_codon:yes stop_codon:yes gene_type:complete
MDNTIKNNIEEKKTKKSIIVGLCLIVLGSIIYIFLGLNIEGYATFRLSRPTDPFALPNLILPAHSFIGIAALLIAFFGGRIIIKAPKKFTLFIALSFFLAIAAFLVWATAGKSFSLTGMLQATVVRAVPIALAAMAGILCERVAVINIGIEGMLLAGAFAGALFGSIFGNFFGLILAVLVGGFFGFILAALVVTFRVDQIIAGVAINIFVLGITSFLTSHLLKSNPELNDAPVFKSINLPVLSDIPVLGPVLFKQNIFVYFSIFIVIISTYYLFKTAYGLRARAVGEHPKAAETLGISVLKTRFHHVIMGGMIAGFGGAWFTLGSVGRFDEGMTGGRGFIGLAAMIFGRWHPVGALFAALIFGFADSLQQKLAILRTPIPSEFLAMAPYLVTIIVVAGIVGNAKPPQAIGQAYVKEN